MLVKTRVYGDVPRTTTGKVRESTLQRIIREARRESGWFDAAVVEVDYASDFQPYAKNYSVVTFDTGSPATHGL